MAKKTIKVKASIRKGKVVKAHNRTITFSKFLDSAKLSYPSRGWDEKGNALVDIKVVSKEHNFKFEHKKANIEEYVKNRKLPLAFQIKEAVYKKHFKNNQ